MHFLPTFLHGKILRPHAVANLKFQVYRTKIVASIPHLKNVLKLMEPFSRQIFLAKCSLPNAPRQVLLAKCSLPNAPRQMLLAKCSSPNANASREMLLEIFSINLFDKFQFCRYTQDSTFTQHFKVNLSNQGTTSLHILLLTLLMKFFKLQQ